MTIEDHNFTDNMCSTVQADASENFVATERRERLKNLWTMPVVPTNDSSFRWYDAKYDTIKT